jgi:hypothetical protein
MRVITIEAGLPDLPVDLQTTQEANARWNGENVELTLSIAIEGHLELLRTTISHNQAKQFAERLKDAIGKGASS